jgi:hypothetical protein
MIAFVKASPDSLFVEANEHYSSGKYEEALHIYRTLIDSEYISSSLYYNMGNAAYRANRLGYAILYYEKALKLDPRNEDAAINLEFVSMYREDNLEALPELFLKRWYRRLVDSFSVNSWSYLSLTLFVTALLCSMAYIFGRRLWIKKTGFFAGLAALVLFILAITALMHRHRQFTQPDRAVIVSPSVVVRSTPSSAGTDLFILHEGTKIRTEEKVGEWTEIRISDGRVGWLPERTIALI